MPTNDSPERLAWNEENLDRVISDLYQEIERDETLRQRLMTDPFEVLNSRIPVPEGYRDKIFVTEKGTEAMIMYLPPRATASREVLPEGTTEVSSQRDYQVLCTPDPPW